MAEPMRPLDPEMIRALRAVIDPELGVNAVDLGLIYEAYRDAELGHVVMTMTTPACPMHEQMTQDAREAVEAMVPGVKRAEIRLVFEPRWTPDRMSDEARELLGWTPPQGETP